MENHGRRLKSCLTALQKKSVSKTITIGMMCMTKQKELTPKSKLFFWPGVYELCRATFSWGDQQLHCT